MWMHACSVFRRNSIVCVSVYTRPRLYIGPSDYLFMYHCFSDVCVCVRVFLRVCKGSAIMCVLKGGLWSAAVPKAPRTWLDRCVWRNLVVCRTAAGGSTMCPFRPGRRQPRYHRTPVRWGWSSGGTATFHSDYRERHNGIAAVMGCVTSRWGAVHWYVTDWGCLQFLRW